MILTFCLISATRAIRASEAASAAFFFSNNDADSDPPVLNVDVPGVVCKRADEAFVFDVFDCIKGLLSDELGTVEEADDDSVELFDILVGISCFVSGRSSVAKLLGMISGTGFSKSLGVLSETDEGYFDGFNADFGACFLIAVGR